jgi:hypothetical protein
LAYQRIDGKLVTPGTDGICYFSGSAQGLERFVVVCGGLPGQRRKSVAAVNPSPAT